MCKKKKKKKTFQFAGCGKKIIFKNKTKISQTPDPFFYFLTIFIMFQN